MTKTLLIASVAALAITSPATAQRGGNQDRPAKEQRQAQRAERPAQQQRAERQSPQRAERQAQRMERQPQRMERQQRMERPSFQRAEARQQRQQQMQERRNVMAERRQQAESRRSQQLERRQQAESRRSQQIERRQQAESRRSQQIERRQQAESRRSQMLERRQQAESRRSQQIERRERADRRAVLADRRQQQVDRRSLANQRMANREDRIRDRQQLRAENFDRRIDGRRTAFAPTADSREIAYSDARRQSAWGGVIERARLAQSRERIRDRQPARALALVGQPLDTRYYYDDYVPLGYRSTYYDTPDYYYRYDDDYGYLYRVRRYDDYVTTLIPLYGGAFSIGQPMPIAYRSYNVPYAYQSYYYDTPDSYYRYGSNAIYQVDPTSQLITAVVALLTGNNLGVGNYLPASYGVYNVPYQYRSRYYDTPDNWYRYDDGMIYQVDPRTRLIESAYPMYDDYYIGNPMPSSWSSYNVPVAYRDIYYDTPEFDYRYADGGIYQVDPSTQVVQALVALVSGNNYAMGQVMPASYGVYNVPYQYRSQYYDTDQYMYRYDDGFVYRMDPRTRVINGMYDVVVA